MRRASRLLGARRYYGLMAQRFSQMKREYQELFQDCFRKQVRGVRGGQCAGIRHCKANCEPWLQS